MAIRGPGSSKEIHTPIESFISTVLAQITVVKWFTDVRTVKTMFGPESVGIDIVNEEQILSGSEENFLRFASLQSGSERVKKITEQVPPDDETILDYDAVSLTNSNIVNGSVKVYNSTDESVLLIEGIDYIIDYANGKLTLVEPEFEGGTATEASPGTPTSPAVGQFNSEAYAIITVQKTLKIHYEYYFFLTRGTDYTINYLKGKLARITSGAIASGDKVFVDYKIVTLVEDSVIELAIDMTHVQIIAEVGESYEGSKDKKLSYAEANLASAMVAKMIISKVINEGLAGSPRLSELTKNMKNLEDSFELNGLKFLRLVSLVSPGPGGVSAVNRNF